MTVSLSTPLGWKSINLVYEQIYPRVFYCYSDGYPFVSRGKFGPIPGGPEPSAESDFAKSDAQLNVVYQKLITKLDATSTAKLRASQRTWLAFRDAQAEFKADLDARDGSMYRQIYAGIEKAITDKRIADLQDFIDNDTSK